MYKFAQRLDDDPRFFELSEPGKKLPLESIRANSAFDEFESLPVNKMFGV